ncbi:MAG: HD domain-containing phosphohydrolase [Ignavibacteriales bacterium]
MKKLVKVLVVEDDLSHAELINRAFESHRQDFKVNFRHNLSEAFQYLTIELPDIVICDWMLPDGRGSEILQADPEKLLFPVVVMTSHGNEELAVEAMKAGALDYVVKSPDTFAQMPDFVLREIREWEHIIARRSAEMKLQQVLLQTVEALAVLVEKRDPYTSGHQKRVSQLSTMIALHMHLNPDAIHGIYIASILHDIGKITIPSEFLNKPGKLEPMEFTIIKTHPQMAHDMLKSIDFNTPVAEIILQHHERLDGSGYPRGLKDSDILLEAKILTVADVVEAMASHRPYRASLGIDAALDEISQNAGTLYDPMVVNCCLELFRSERFTFIEKGPVS